MCVCLHMWENDITICRVMTSLAEHSPSAFFLASNLKSKTTVCVCWPMVEDSVNHKPLHLYTKTQVFFLQLCIHGVLVLPLHALVLLSLTKFNGRWFIHVIFPLVVSKHHLAVQLKLEKENERWDDIYAFLQMVLCHKVTRDSLNKEQYRKTIANLH